MNERQRLDLVARQLLRPPIHWQTHYVRVARELDAIERLPGRGVALDLCKRRVERALIAHLEDWLAA
jgi:hypothetical protein